MKVAIVHDYIAKVGGAQNVLKIIHQIYPDAPVYTLLYDKEKSRGEFEDGYKIIPSSLQRFPRFLRNRSKLLLTHFPRAIEEFDLSDYDVVISSSNSYAHGVITRPDTLHISYCYSPMRFAWDWHAEYLAENNLDRGYISIAVRNILKGLRQWDYLAAQRVDRWVAISKTVQQRIKKYYRADSDIIFPPANIKNLLTAQDKPGDYYLIVSHLTPYKKIDLAVEAFNRSGKKLIIAGEGPDRARLEKLNSNKNTEFLGYVSNKQYEELLLNCRAFIFPGEEDFGLTPIEAMASGKGVIAFNKGGVTETVISGKTGFFFDEVNSDSLNQAIETFEKNSHLISAASCRQQAESFSTEHFIKTFRSYVDKAYKAHHEKITKV